MIILQYAAFLLPTCKDQWTGIHEQSGARITCKKFCENRQWILLDTVYYHDCGSNLYPGIFNCNSSKLLLHTATFRGQQGRISRTVWAILNGQPSRSAERTFVHSANQYSL